MKVVYPVCCGVDVHKSFFIATIITTTSDIQPSYSRIRFSTFNNDIIRFADRLNQNNCNDVSLFGSSKRLCSWAGLTPGSNESAGKKKSVRIIRAGVYLKPALVEIAHSAVKSTKSPYYKNKYEKLVKRRG